MSVERLRAISARLRSLAPDKAAELDRAIAEIAAGKRDAASVQVGIGYRLEKFDGEYRPGRMPVEVIEGRD